MKINKNQHITRDGIVKKNPTSKDSKNAKVLMLKLNVFLKKLCKDNASECMLVITKESPTLIVVSVDGFLYSNVYDPTMSEIPYLLKDAAEEFGVKQKFNYDVWQYRNSFDKIVASHGWHAGNYDSGIIHLHKE